MSALTGIAEAVLDDCREVMKAQVEADQWDVEPALAVVLTEGGVVGSFVPVDVDIAGTEDLPMHSRLNLLAAVIKRAETAIPLPPGTEVWGVGFFTEGWGLYPKADEAEAAQAWVEAGGKIADHPAGKEVKLVTLVDRRNDRYGIQWIRGEAQALVVDAPEIAGRVPEALARIVDALVASAGRADTPPRPAP